MSFAWIERELKKTGDPRDNERAAIIAAMHKARENDIPLPVAKNSRSEVLAAPELNLEAEWQRQANRYVELGYHRKLGLTEEAYLASLPKFEPQPEDYRGKFDVTLLVETRIPWERQAQLAVISAFDYLRERINQTRPWDGRSKTPETPYTGWFNGWGQRFPDKITPFDARKQLTQDEIGAGPFEGIALQITHPELTRSGKYFDLIGYQVESGRVPCLHRWHGRPRLGAGWGGDAHVDFRPLVRGSKIVTG